MGTGSFKVLESDDLSSVIFWVEHQTSKVQKDDCPHPKSQDNMNQYKLHSVYSDIAKVNLTFMGCGVTALEIEFYQRLPKQMPTGVSWYLAHIP